MLHHIWRVGVADDALAAIAIIAGAENTAAVDTAVDVAALADPTAAVVSLDYVVGAAISLLMWPSLVPRRAAFAVTPSTIATSMRSTPTPLFPSRPS